MESGEQRPVFPYDIIWEEFDPSFELTWEWLEHNRDDWELIFRIAQMGHFQIPFVDEPMIQELARISLGQEASQTLVHKLYLIAGWQVTGQFRKLIGIDLRGQRPALKRLQVAAFEFWKASLHVSGHVHALLPWLHAVEPDRLLTDDSELDLSRLGSAAHDVSLAAERAYEDTKPTRTGRTPEARRDNAVRLAAEIIELETAESIAMSRGNRAKPAPHFSNAGGYLLRNFFKLVDSKVDERLLVQSLNRVRKRAGAQKN